MTSISRQVSDVSAISLALTDASATVTAESTGSASFGGLVISRRGKPNAIISINSKNMLEKLGKPFHMREGVHAESLRHASEAVIGGNGYVVRVMPSDSRYPVVAIDKAYVGEVNPTNLTALPYGDEVTNDDINDIVRFYLIDGDNELKRSFAIQPVPEAEYGEGMLELSLFETDNLGSKKTLESHIVSFSVEAQFNGASAFVEDVLDRMSNRLNCSVTLANVKEFKSVAETEFVGGTSGTYSSISTADYNNAAQILDASVVNFTHVLSLGCYEDATLAKLAQICFDRNINAFIDVEPNISYADAITRAQSLAFNSRFVCLLFLPYSSNDPFYGGRSIYGASGAAFKAKSMGISKSQPVGGWHFSFAGLERGIISRQGLVLNENAGVADYSAMVKVRLNKAVVNSDGFVMFDDTLTTSLKVDQLRFEHVVSVDNAIGRAMVTLFSSLKHEPDGVTLKGLSRGVDDILEPFVTSGALVKPSNPEDGTQEYVVYIEKAAPDLWSIRWDICITGISRRMVGQARLFS